jgi:hypothetical protein
MGGAAIGVVQEFWNARDKEPMAKGKPSAYTARWGSV